MTLRAPMLLTLGRRSRCTSCNTTAAAFVRVGREPCLLFCRVCADRIGLLARRLPTHGDHHDDDRDDHPTDAA